MARNEDSGSNSTVQQSHIPVCYGSAFGRNGCTGINHCLFSVCRPNFRVQFIVFIKKKHKKLVLIAYYLEITHSTAI